MKRSKIVKVNNPQGIHMRPAALIVSTASRYNSSINLFNCEKRANAKRILEVATLGAAKDTILEIEAEGDDANDAIEAIADVITKDFNYIPVEQPT